MFTIKRQVFFSFHYDNDSWRASQIRNMGVVESQKIFSDNSWETVRRKSNTAIKNWINNEMKWRSCVIVLIGEKTASREWVQYEIEQAWREGKGIAGIYIDRLKDYNGNQSERGRNPFDDFCIDTTFNYIVKCYKPADKNEIKLSSIVKTYDSSFYRSEYVYNDIKRNIENLIEEAIKIRNSYPK